MVMYICFNATLEICLTLSFPDCVHKSVFCVCVSIAGPQIGAVPFSAFLLNNKMSISSVTRLSGLGEITHKEEGGEEGKVAPTDSSLISSRII